MLTSRNRLTGVVWLLVLLSLAACSTGGRKGKYTPGTQDTSLEVPPGLSKPEQRQAMAIPSIAADRTSYSEYQQQGSTEARNRNLLPSLRNARLVREGDILWLEIELPPSQVWDDMERFLKSEGFKISYKNPAIGIMQTDWQENQEYLPSNWFARTLNKLTSSGLMDRYRVRLERTGDPDWTRVILTHAGMEEVALNDAGTDVVETLWQPRDSDPELEAEMLLRFLVFQGLAEPEAEKIVPVEEVGKEVSRAEMVDANGIKVIGVQENFPRTWRRVGLAIDRLGLTVEDKNRSDGVYLISLNEDFLKTHQEEEGLVGKLFGSKRKQQTEFVIKVTDQGDHSVVSLHDRKGKLSAAPHAVLVTELLYAQLR